MPDNNGGGSPSSTGAVGTDDKSLMELTRLLLKAINQPTNPARVSKADLPKRIGLTPGRVNSILNPGPQGLTKISIDDIGKIVTFAREFARTQPAGNYRDLVNGYCNEITQRLHSELERGGLSPTENTFVTNLRLLSTTKQQEFSDRHAGVYALIRLDREGHILISRMDVRPREHQLCRFATDSSGPGLNEPNVEGYIFAINDTIQTVGRPSSESGLRTAILRSRRTSRSAGWNMIGLRLGISEYDGGPFAYRIYCRWIAGRDQVGQAMPDWSKIFGVRRHEEALTLQPMVGDIEDILALLREHDDPETPWGIRIPTGIMPTAYRDASQSDR